MTNFSSKFILCFICITIVAGRTFFSQNLNDDFLAPSNRLAFGNLLFNEEDYLRAIDEYLAVLKTIPNDTLNFKIAYAYQKMDKLDQATDYFKGLFFSSDFYHESRLEYYKTDFLKFNFDSFRENVTDGYYVTEVNKRNVCALVNLSYLMDKIILPDSSEFIAPFGEKYKTDIAEFYWRKLHPDSKNLTTGIILSSILPGAGKIYADQLTDGLTAFLVTGIFSFLAYDNFKADHNFRGWLFTALATYFYAGNIYGTAAAVQQYNAGVKLNFDSDVRVYLKKNNYLMPEYDFLR